MMPRPWVYFVGWMLAAGASLGACTSFGPGAELRFDHPAVLGGIATAGLASAVAHVLLLRGHLKYPDRFIGWWGISLAVKGSILITAWGIVVLSGWVPVQPFLWSMAISTVLFLHLGLVHLLRLPARAGGDKKEEWRG